LRDASDDLPARWRVAAAGVLVSPAVLVIAIVLALVGAVLGWHLFPRLSPGGRGRGVEVRGR
jgi:hypothetical protein